MADLRKRFGRLVAGHRRRRGLTQAQLAELADVSSDMISKIEIGTSGARFPVIERIAASLEVDPAELFAVSGTEVRPGPFQDLAIRLAGMSDDELKWVDGILEAALQRTR
jgi:transcriptional regulator with XRE-family HTH domain